MATARSKSRMELNRKAFDAITLAQVDGLHAVALEVIATTRPPDAPPIGEGLVQGGGTLAYLGNKKVAGEMQDGRNVSKPRSLRVKAGEMVAIAGWGFPGRFVEKGTVDTPSEPFLTPAVNRVTPSGERIITEGIREHLSGLGSPTAPLRHV